MAGLTIDRPIGLAEAISSPRVIPGDTIYLVGGTYRGNFTATISGTEANPIIIRPYLGSRVIIDGSLTIDGDYTHWHNIELGLSDGVHTTEEEGSHPAITQGGLTVNGSNNKIIGWTIYDQVDNRIAWWGSADGGEVYGCVVFDNGWIAPDRGHGHSIYTQNRSTNGLKTIKHSIFGQGYAPSTGSTNLAQYASGGDACANYRITETAFITGSQLVGGGTTTNNVIDECHIYNDGLTVGYQDEDNVDLTITDCVIRGRCSPLYLPTFTMSGTRIYSSHETYLIYSAEPAAGVTAYNLSGNAYHYDGGAAEPFFVNTVDAFNFTAWKARYSTDADSTYTTDAPGTNAVYVYPNAYLDDETRRMGIIVVWNWQGLDSVNMDMTTLGLTNGVTYYLHSAIDYFDDVISFVASADPVAVDMRAVSHGVRTPTGYTEPLADTTFPTFGAFVVERTL